MVFGFPTSIFKKEPSLEQKANASMNLFSQALKEIEVNELGDSTNAVEYKTTLSDLGVLGGYKARYEFETELGTEYEVEILADIDNEHPELTLASIDFVVKKGSWNDVTNRGEYGVVMATVIKIAKDFWEDRENNKAEVHGFMFAPAGNKEKKRQRDLLYKAYIDTQFPNATVEKRGNWTYVYPEGIPKPNALEFEFVGMETYEGSPSRIFCNYKVGEDGRQGDVWFAAEIIDGEFGIEGPGLTIETPNAVQIQTDIDSNVSKKAFDSTVGLIIDDFRTSRVWNVEAAAKELGAEKPYVQTITTFENDDASHLVESEIQELGDTTEGAEFEVVRVDVESETEYTFIYEFSTTKSVTRYEVVIESVGSETAKMSFYPYSASYDTVTNRGESAEIMATVLDIAKSFWEDRSYNNINAEAFAYTPAGSGKKGRQRDMLYKAYVQTQFPNATIKKEVGEVVVYPDDLQEREIRELGDSTNAANFRLKRSNVYAPTGFDLLYEFETGSGVRYIVKITDMSFGPGYSETVASVIFDAGKGGFKVNNRGEYAEVMATVLAIAKEVQDSKEELGIRFDGFHFSSVGANQRKKDQRTKLYRAFIETQFPNANVEEHGHEVVVYTESVVNELGDSTDAFDYYLDFEQALGNMFTFIYEFDTDLGTEYLVTIDAFSENTGRTLADVSFEIRGKPHQHVSNKGEQFRVMATVIKIAREFWENEAPTLETPPDAFQFTAAGSEPEKRKQRKRLYMAYVSKVWPESETEIEANSVVVHPPKLRERLREAVRSLLLRELGDTRDTYEFRETSFVVEPFSAKVEYEFENKNGTRYKVKVEQWGKSSRHKGDLYAEVSFVTYDSSGDLMSITDVVNEGDVFKTIATVLEAAKESTVNWIPEVEDQMEEEVPVLAFIPVGSGGKHEQRAKLYQTFIDNRFSGRIERENDYYFVKYK